MLALEMILFRWMLLTNLLALVEQARGSAAAGVADMVRPVHSSRIDVLEL